MCVVSVKCPATMALAGDERQRHTDQPRQGQGPGQADPATDAALRHQAERLRLVDGPAGAARRVHEQSGLGCKGWPAANLWRAQQAPGTVDVHRRGRGWSSPMKSKRAASCATLARRMPEPVR